MAQFRSTADVMDLILTNGGEVTSGTSSYETQVLSFLNRVHFTMVAGGTIPLGKDTTVEIDEIWPWSRADRPIIMELQPKHDTGTITLTQGSEAGVFSSAPSASLQGWHIKVEGRPELFKIAQHTAASTAFELDSLYTDESGDLNYEAFKLDYEVLPDVLVIDSGNDKLQFQKAAGTTLTATLTHGVYSPSALATHAAAVITTAASGPTITGSYSAVTRKFSLTSDLAGATSFIIVGNGNQADQSAHKTLGFDDETTSSAGTHTSVYALGGICRMIEPFKIHRGERGEGSVYGIDAEAFQRGYPLNTVSEGYPDRFCVMKEKADGTIIVRFNRFPQYKTRIEVEHVAVPRDLKDNSSSIPLLPRKHIDVLEDAGTFYLMLLKSDDRMQVYANLVQGKLKAMIAQNRGMQSRTGRDFGQIVSRADMMRNGRRRQRLLFGSGG